jgi:hypothetical protein
MCIYSVHDNCACFRVLIHKRCRGRCVFSIVIVAVLFI